MQGCKFNLGLELCTVLGAGLSNAGRPPSTLSPDGVTALFEARL
jgi:hypothetical protein